MEIDVRIAQHNCPTIISGKTITCRIDTEPGDALRFVRQSRRTTRTHYLKSQSTRRSGSQKCLRFLARFSAVHQMTED
jgi:hypothetical protein